MTQRPVQLQLVMPSILIAIHVTAACTVGYHSCSMPACN